jgi:subtilase family serine protease
MKNIKGASLTNTRPNEFKDEITLNFGNGVDISKGVYISPDEISGPVKMPQNNSKVDLVVSSIALSPAPPVAGKPLTVKFQIKNIGTVKTSTGTITAGVYWNNILIGSVTHGDLAAGASTAVLSVTLNAQYVTAGNKNTVMAVADSTNIVIEMRETNNTNSATFLIDNRPDLKMTAITLSSTKPGKTTVSFKIANTGFGPTAAGTGAQTAAVYVNNNLAGTVNYNDLAKGAVVSLQLANVTVTAGTCKVKVVADSAGIVPEVSKTNNSLEKPFSIK